MSKVDLKQKYKSLYNPSAKDVSEVDVPLLHYLMVDGKGDPNTSEEYKEAVEALFSLSYALKFAIKRRGGPDNTVMPLEGLWWTDRPGEFDPGREDEFRWTAMIAQPPEVTDGMFAEIRKQVKQKKKLSALDRVRFERYDEGKAVQILHLGSYSEEKPTIDRLHAYVASKGMTLTGKHHEIYLNDPARTDPGKLKTLIRQPVK